MDLFRQASQRESERSGPLAHRIRPRRLEEFVGQEHLLGEESLLGRSIRDRRPFSMLLWGPPGTGKTTLAYLLADLWGVSIVRLSATDAGVKDVRQVVQRGQAARSMEGRSIVLFLDEIHRFNKAQQDRLLPAVEQGDVVLVGATTENPSFEVIGPLLSRTRVLRLEPLAADHVRQLLQRALVDRDHGLGRWELEAEEPALDRIARWCRGDARAALGLLERSAEMALGQGGGITAELVEVAAGDDWILYDRAGDEHYDTASALIKSMRGSDPDAALLWLGKMVSAGEDPKFIMRRVMICAAEDVGNADPLALLLSVSAAQACERVGLPEARIIMAQAVAYVAAAPKSNAAVDAIDRAQALVEEGADLTVPHHLKGSTFSLAKQFGFGDGYRYPHDHPDGFIPQEYFPPGLEPRRLYTPRPSGREGRIRDRLRQLWPERWAEPEPD